jgi:hypothetical protein
MRDPIFVIATFVRALHAESVAHETPASAHAAVRASETLAASSRHFAGAEAANRS